MKKEVRNSIFSAVIGSAFFAVPFAALNIPLLPSLGIAIAAYGAGNLILSDSNKKVISDMEKINNILSDKNASIEDKIKVSRKMTDKLYIVSKQIENDTLVANIGKIRDTSVKIIDAVEKDHNKYKKVETFFDYYLPVTIKILLNYDEIENQKLNSEESKQMMKNTENIINKISGSFEEQLSKLFQSNIIDTEAEIKVFDTMLNSEGFTDYKIK